MDLGVSAFTAYAADFASFCALTAGLGLQRVELRNFIGTDDFVDPPDPAPLAAALRQNGLGSTVHAPWRLNLAAVDENERNHALLHYRRCIDTAAELASAVVVFHGGWFEDGSRADDGLHRARASIERLLRYAEPLNVTIALENDEVSRPTLFRSPEAFVTLDLPGLHCVLDVGHAHTLGYTASDFVGVFGERLAEVHLHDNRGAHDEHLPVGDGTIDWQATRAALTPYPDVVYMLECKSIPCMGRSVSALRALFSDMGAVSMPRAEGR